MLIPNQPTISTCCGSAACIEVIAGAVTVRVRDTKTGAEVTLTVDAYRAFVAALKSGQLDG